MKSSKKLFILSMIVAGSLIASSAYSTLIIYKSNQTVFFKVITVISGQIPRRPENARKPNPRFT